MTAQNYIPSSPKEAKLLGFTSYFSGKPCPKGHVANRRTNSSVCVECKALDDRSRAERAKLHPESLGALRAKHRKSKHKARSTEEGKRLQYEANRRYIEKNREKVNEYYRTRGRQDPVFKVQRAARSMLAKVLARTNRRKDAKCVEILGYTGKQLKEHLERQFTAGMSWDVFGEQIHIDHIIPVAEMLRAGITDPAVINALTNLRPMWAKDNIRKSDQVLTLL